MGKESSDKYVSQLLSMLIRIGFGYLIVAPVAIATTANWGARLDHAVLLCGGFGIWLGSKESKKSMPSIHKELRPTALERFVFHVRDITLFIIWFCGLILLGIGIIKGVFPLDEPWVTIAPVERALVLRLFLPSIMLFTALFVITAGFPKRDKIELDGVIQKDTFSILPEDEEYESEEEEPEDRE